MLDHRELKSLETMTETVLLKITTNTRHKLIVLYHLYVPLADSIVHSQNRFRPIYYKANYGWHSFQYCCLTIFQLQGLFKSFKILYHSDSSTWQKITNQCKTVYKEKLTSL